MIVSRHSIDGTGGCKEIHLSVKRIKSNGYKILTGGEFSTVVRFGLGKTSKLSIFLNVIQVCPVGAITEADTQAVVNPDTCIDCGVCISECPQGAICNDADADEKWIKFNAEESAKA